MMGKSIFLPATEDTIITVHLGKDSVDIDAFDLDTLFITANNKSVEMGSDWNDEFPSLFQKKYKKNITPGQAILLWNGHRDFMEDLKKSLSHASMSLKKPVTSSKPKTSKKKG